MLEVFGCDLGADDPPCLFRGGGALHQDRGLLEHERRSVGRVAQLDEPHCVAVRVAVQGSAVEIGGPNDWHPACSARGGEVRASPVPHQGSCRGTPAGAEERHRHGGRRGRDVCVVGPAGEEPGELSPWGADLRDVGDVSVDRCDCGLPRLLLGEDGQACLLEDAGEDPVALRDERDVPKRCGLTELGPQRGEIPPCCERRGDQGGEDAVGVEILDAGGHEEGVEVGVSVEDVREPLALAGLELHASVRRVHDHRASRPAAGRETVADVGECGEWAPAAGGDRGQQGERLSGQGGVGDPDRGRVRIDSFDEVRKSRQGDSSVGFDGGTEVFPESRQQKDAGAASRVSHKAAQCSVRGPVPQGRTRHRPEVLGEGQGGVMAAMAGSRARIQRRRVRGPDFVRKGVDRDRRIRPKCSDPGRELELERVLDI
ncbi:unannotated protein [freshwater metagenome]|uniref:Unannotated protein n=1 Tax=freshwater metagenome TaxID=449393 RepID=A0A6J7JB66_9ZZZZ